MTFGGTGVVEGTRDPKQKDPPIPTAAKLLALGAGIITGVMAGVLSYRLGFNPEIIPNENFLDLVVLTSVLWVVTTGFLAIGTRQPPIPEPPQPKEPGIVEG